MASVNVRNLEQIQEQDSARPSRIGTLLLVSLAGAAVVTAFVMMSKKGGSPTRSTQDPLAQLVADAKTPGTPAEVLDGKDVSFPRILSDEATPTTALAAVKDERGRLVKQGDVAADPARDANGGLMPPPAKTDTELAPEGMEGGFQLQVASFKEQADADRAVEDLRKRGHRAFRQAAHVPDRGLWHRVRVGPFKTKLEALKYKDRFERTERIAPFLIDPDKVKQAEDIRAAKIAALAKRRERSTGE